MYLASCWRKWPCMPILGGGLDITVEVRSPTLPLASGPVVLRQIGQPLTEDEECAPPRRVADSQRGHSPPPPQQTGVNE